MKILITHAYAKENKGDAAILSVLIRQLKDAFPNCSMAIAIYAKTLDEDSFDGIRLISNSMYHAIYRFHFLPMKLANTIRVEGALLLWAFIYFITKKSFRILVPQCVKSIADEYFAAELIVPIGGGYLRAKKGIQENVNLWLLLNPIIICLLLQKPIILYTQSIGPLATPFQEWMVRVVLNRTNLILVREDHTIATLNRIGVDDSLVIRTVDSGFLFQAPHIFTLRDFVPDKAFLDGKILIGVTVRAWMDPKEQTFFENAVAQFINNFKSDDPVVFLFIPQVTAILHGDDDRLVATRIVSLITAKEKVLNLTGVYDHYKLKDFYSNLDFLIGTRFHSVIFSITARVPSLAIEYEYKTSGIMNDLGLSEWVIPIEKVTRENLDDKFLELIKRKDEYRKILDTALPAYFAQAEYVVTELQRAFNYFRIGR